MPTIPTRMVRYRSSGALVRINADDFNPELHAEPVAEAQPQPPAAQPAPEPAPPASEHKPRRRG